MLTVTIGELLDRQLDDLDTEAARLYVVRDRETVFYVGQSFTPLGRVWQHVYNPHMSHLGRFISANLPDAYNWQIELLPLSEVDPAFTDLTFIREAEARLIRSLSPCLNRSLNPNPSPLPPGYIDPDETYREVIEQAGALVPYLVRYE